MKDNLIRRSELISVVDGDTIEAKIYIGNGLSFIKHIRLVGIDTPERWEDGYDEATNFTREHCEGEGKVMHLEFLEEDEKTTEFKDGGFGRLLAKVHIDDGNSQYCLNDLLLSSGHATVYEK